jgi:hypothetical protein
VSANHVGYAALVARAASWLAWFGALFALWLALVGVVQHVELIAGLCGAAVGATAVDVVRAQGLLRYRVDPRWVLVLGRHVLRVVPDFVRLMVALPRRPRGSFRTLDFPVGGERGIDAGRRAFAVFAPSLAPNRLVVDADPEAGGAVVHDLLPESAPPRLL